MRRILGMIVLFGALWICAIPSFAADRPARPPLYKTTADFLKDCGGPAPSQLPCTVAFALVESTSPISCHPSTATRDPVEGKAKYAALMVSVTSWLKKHLQYSSKPYAEGVHAGLLALYPCQ